MSYFHWKRHYEQRESELQEQSSNSIEDVNFFPNLDV